MPIADVLVPAVAFATLIGTYLPLVFGPEPGKVRLWDARFDAWQWEPRREPWTRRVSMLQLKALLDQKLAEREQE